MFKTLQIVVVGVFFSSGTAMLISWLGSTEKVTDSSQIELLVLGILIIIAGIGLNKLLNKPCCQ